MFNLLDTVVLDRDLPEHGLRRGTSARWSMFTRLMVSKLSPFLPLERHRLS
jgi:hypothetical protein